MFKVPRRLSDLDGCHCCFTGGPFMFFFKNTTIHNLTDLAVPFRIKFWHFNFASYAKWTFETDIKYKVCQFQSAVGESLIWCPALSRFQLGTVAFISPQFAILQCRHCLYTRCHCALSLGWGRWTIVVIKYSRFLKKESSVQRKSNKKRKK